MVSRTQVAAVWMTVTMLLAQMVCPGVAFGCGCQSTATCFSGQRACCCSGEKAKVTTRSCPHCHPVSDSSTESDAPQLARGTAKKSEWGTVCHCSDDAPRIPAEEYIPDASESDFRLLWDVISNFDSCLSTQVVLECSPMRPRVPSSEELTHNYKQIVLCVWLT